MSQQRDDSFLMRVRFDRIALFALAIAGACGGEIASSAPDGGSAGDAAMVDGGDHGELSAAPPGDAAQPAADATALFDLVVPSADLSGCAPSCGQRACGDDGCGGSCGACNGTQSCDSNGNCVDTCTPMCAGASCGDDGCGGSCGACGGGAACVAGHCVANCKPACAGRHCGDDGCGGSCGACAGAEACTSAGQCVSAPAGPAALRFDVATRECAQSNPTCSVGGTSYPSCCPTGSAAKCLCDPEFDHLNYKSQSHFLAVGSDAHRGDIWAAGNFQSVYVNDINAAWATGGTGADEADQVMASAMSSFPTGVPKYFIGNEISTSLWPSSQPYRDYINAFAARMNGHYGKTLIIASPFPAPGVAHAADWKTLALNALVAVEVQITGSDVSGSASPLTYCKTTYMNSINAYSSVHVGVDRLVLVDNYANTSLNSHSPPFGRNGVSLSAWQTTIDTRAAAATSLGFAGYISYAWANNEMGNDNAARAAFEDHYAAHALP